MGSRAEDVLLLIIEKDMSAKSPQDRSLRVNTDKVGLVATPKPSRERTRNTSMSVSANSASAQRVEWL
jgi:hypothetical protein